MAFHSRRRLGGKYCVVLAGISPPPWPRLVIEQEYVPSGSLATSKASWSFDPLAFQYPFPVARQVIRAGMRIILLHLPGLFGLPIRALEGHGKVLAAFNPVPRPFPCRSRSTGPRTCRSRSMTGSFTLGGS